MSDRDAPDRAQDPRPTCFLCRRPQSLCLCEDVPRLGNQTGVHLLQHVRERGHPLGTARLAQLGLGAQTHVLFSERPDGSSRPVALPQGAALLYPSPDARLLDPADPPSHLVAIDGTWHQAHQLHRDNPWVRALPHVRLLPTAPSRYRIRREPQADYVSTLEALLQALQIIEPELSGVDDLLAAFDRMIDRHLAHRSSDAGARPRTRAPRKGRSRTIPWDMLDHPDRCVLVHVEPGPLPDPRAPIALCAWRGDGRTIEALVEDAPARLVALAELPSSTARCSTDALIARLSHLTEDAAVFVWRPNQLRWLRAAGVDVTGWESLSAVWARARPGQALPEPAPTALLGRGGRRIAIGMHMLAELRGDPAE